MTQNIVIFRECSIKEYINKDAFFKDSPENKILSYQQANGNEKGVIIEYYDTIEKKNNYVYCNHKFESWEEFNMGKIMGQIKFRKGTSWNVSRNHILVFKTI